MTNHRLRVRINGTEYLAEAEPLNREEVERGEAHNYVYRSELPVGFYLKVAADEDSGALKALRNENWVYRLFQRIKRRSGGGGIFRHMKDHVHADHFIGMEKEVSGSRDVMVTRDVNVSYVDGKPINLGHSLAREMFGPEETPSYPDDYLLSRQLNPYDALRIYTALLRELEPVHGLGLLFFDLKPKNIQVQATPEKVRVILLDWGIAKRVKSTLDKLSDREVIDETIGGYSKGTIKYGWAFHPPEVDFNFHPPEQRKNEENQQQHLSLMERNLYKAYLEQLLGRTVNKDELLKEHQAYLLDLKGHPNQDHYIAGDILCALLTTRQMCYWYLQAEGDEQKIKADIETAIRQGMKKRGDPLLPELEKQLAPLAEFVTTAAHYLPANRFQGCGEALAATQKIALEKVYSIEYYPLDESLIPADQAVVPPADLESILQQIGEVRLTSLELPAVDLNFPEVKVKPLDSIEVRLREEGPDGSVREVFSYRFDERIDEGASTAIPSPPTDSPVQYCQRLQEEMDSIVEEVIRTDREKREQGNKNSEKKRRPFPDGTYRRISEKKAKS